MNRTVIVKTSHHHDRHGFKHMLPTLCASLLSLRPTRMGRFTPSQMHYPGGHEANTAPTYDMLVATDVGGNAYSYCDTL
jgi:hypothetical protein